MGRFLLLPLPLLLVACGGGTKTDTVTNSSTTTTTTTTGGGAATPMQPGKWRTEVKVVSVDIPGMPAAQADMVKAQMEKAVSTVESCLTPEQASKPPSEMLGGQAGCTSERMTIANGRVDAALTCRPPSGGEVRSTTTGTMTATSMDLTSDTKISGMAGMPGPMTQRTQVRSQRIGDCAATG